MPPLAPLGEAPQSATPRIHYQSRASPKGAEGHPPPTARVGG
jgi:hypothetical protein